MFDYKDILNKRWEGHEKALEQLIPILKVSNDWDKSEAYRNLLDALGSLPKNREAVRRDLRGAPFSTIDTWVFHSSLVASGWRSKAYEQLLPEADLSGAYLADADLSKARLSRVNLSGAVLIRANLSDARLWGANLSGVDLADADLSGADLWGANLSGAFLGGTNLSGARLGGGANLSGAYLGGVKYTTDEIFDRLIKCWIPRILHVLLLGKVKWKPLRVTDFESLDFSKVDSSANPVLKRHVEDYQFVHAFKRKSWFHRLIFFPLWKATSDCGRSLLLWLLWSLGLVGFFTYVYSNHLYWFTQPNLDWIDVLYFNVVTFTTLGFGDISPKIGNHLAQGWVMVEVIIGYIMLGGLISILANKLARRA